MTTIINLETVAHRVEWVKALRSDEWHQAHRFLRVQNGDASYCCLGVACTLADIGEWNDAWEDFEAQTQGQPDDPQHNWELICDGNSFDEMPPEELSDWLGLSDEHFHRLAVLNDGGTMVDPKDRTNTLVFKEHSFAQIADVLESKDWFGPDLQDDPIPVADMVLPPAFAT